MKHFAYQRFILLFLLMIPIVFLHTSTVSANNTLKVGVLQNNAPLSSEKSAHKIHGANIAVANELGDDLGKKTKIVAYQNKKQLTQKLAAGKIDVALGSFSQKNSSNRNYQLSKPFFYVENVLFRRSDSTKKSIKKLTGKKVGLLENGTQGNLLNELCFKKKRYSSVSELVTALKNKKIKAAILTGPQYTSYLQKHPQYTQAKDHTDQEQTKQVLKRIKDPQITAQKVTVATYHSKKIHQKINKDLEKMTKDGRLNKISNKYFGKDITQE